MPVNHRVPALGKSTFADLLLARQIGEVENGGAPAKGVISTGGGSELRFLIFSVCVVFCRTGRLLLPDQTI